LSLNLKEEYPAESKEYLSNCVTGEAEKWMRAVVKGTRNHRRLFRMLIAADQAQSSGSSPLNSKNLKPCLSPKYMNCL
jgi:hypothetical protein